MLQIGNNEETLSSHYEVRSNIDMSTVRGESIGFLNGELVGFSGSIVGTTSQAGISNFSISFADGKGVIAPKADGTSYYAGIFAQINHDAYIKNLTISAKFDLNTLGYNGNYRIALLAGINYGRLSNVSAEVLESNIAVRGGGDFAIGGLVGENGVISYEEDATEVSKAGEILQNFSSYAESENEIEGYFTIEEGLAAAKEAGKPVFVDITGHGCVNCREMESRVWSDPQVLDILRNEYVIVALYTDDKTRLGKDEWVETENGDILKDLGRVNSYIARTRFGVNAQPNYVLLSPDGELLAPVRGYDLSIPGFIEFLESGLESR